MIKSVNACALFLLIPVLPGSSEPGFAHIRYFSVDRPLERNSALQSFRWSWQCKSFQCFSSCCFQVLCQSYQYLSDANV